MIRTLVLGVGGTNSITIIKALKMTSFPIFIVGTDIKPLNAGTGLVDEVFLVAPVIDEQRYLQNIERIIDLKKIDIVFATTEAEITFLSRKKEYLEERHEVVIMVADLRVWNVCQDKYKTQIFLKDNGFTYIPTLSIGTVGDTKRFVEENGYPIIQKPIHGYGSKGIRIIYNNEELKKNIEGSGFILQKYIESAISDEFDEYTAEVFVNKDDTVAGGIIIQRTLLKGESHSGRVVRDDEGLEYLQSVAKKLGIRGPCNFQYRKKDKKIYIFEINARYSGTSAVRAHYGFNNVELALSSFVQQEHKTIPNAAIREGYFVRYWEEAYYDVETVAELTRKKHLEHEE